MLICLAVSIKTCSLGDRSTIVVCTEYRMAIQCDNFMWCYYEQRNAYFTRLLAHYAWSRNENGYVYVYGHGVTTWTMGIEYELSCKTTHYY